MVSFKKTFSSLIVLSMCLSLSSCDWFSKDVTFDNAYKSLFEIKELDKGIMNFKDSAMSQD